MKKLVLLSFLLFATLYSMAQQNEQEAFQKFKQAREAYGNENYAKTVDLLTETKTLLGSTNIRIQPMLIQSLVKVKDWHRANDEIDVYYSLDPDKSLVEYQEIVELDKNVDSFAKKDEDDYKSITNSLSLKDMQDYLSEFPFAKYKSEVEDMLSTAYDKLAWDQAKSVNNTAALQAYLEDYPSGDYSDEAKRTIGIWDDAAYEKARDDGTQQALNYYLNNYPNGNYRSMVESLLVTRKEDDAYAATRSGNLKDFDTYLNKYPNGTYSETVRNELETTLFNQAERSYELENYDTAIIEYQALLDRFPSSSYASTATRKIKKAKSKGSQYSSGYFGFTYESQGAIGITSGKLNKDGVGFYFNLRATPEALDNQWSEPETVIEENAIPDNEKLGIANMSIGLSYPIAYPLWFYVGGGANYQERFVEGTDENVYYKLTDEDLLSFFPEGGLKYRLSGRLTLIGGVSYIRDEALYKVGIGF